MRTQLIAGLLFAGALSAIGCTANTDTAEDTQSSVSEEALSSTQIGRKLPGDYVADGSLYPTLRLEADKTYSWDTGIRCVRAPCPSGESGRWALYRSYGANRFYVGLTSSNGGEHWFRVVTSGNDITRLDGVWGEKTSFVPRASDPCATVRCGFGTVCEVQNGRAVCVKPPPVGCAATLCGPNTFCHEENGQAQCVPYQTCATTQLLCVDPNQKCVDQPIVCVKAPCPPTAPACGYVCPKDGTINCMPPLLSKEAQALCSGAYHQWIGDNCPNVMFVY